MNFDVAVIGGGISGLTIAYDLHRCGQRVVVLERQQQIGGNAISERIDGFLMEHGPSTLNTLAPQASQLANEIGLGDQMLNLGEGVKKRYLCHNATLHGISTKPTGFLRSSYLSLPGRLNILAEIFRRPQKLNHDETVHAFATRRFGREFADKVMEPLAAGMFAGNSHRLSVDAVFPKLKQMERDFGSITRAIIRAKKGSEPGKRLFSFAEGVAQLPRTLAAKMPAQIKLATAVKSIFQRQNGYQIDTAAKGSFTASSVILAVQPHVAAQLLEPIDAQAAIAASQIAAPPMSVVFAAYQRDQVGHPLDSLGFLSVSESDSIITGAQFCSTMFDGRAPAGHVSISAYVGGARNSNWACKDSAELMAQVHEELATLLQITGKPVLMRCRQWVRSLPQYEIGHGRKIRPLLEISQRNSGLYVVGNYLCGVSMANCIKHARKTALDVAQYLDAQSPQSHSKRFS